MFNPRRLPNGNLQVPARIEAGDAVGDGSMELAPGDEDYEAWDRWMKIAESYEHES